MMPNMTNTEQVTTREAMVILGLADPSTVTRLVAERKLTPARKLPGRTGAFLFERADIDRLAAARKAAAA